MIIIPASAGIILAIILLVVFSKQIGSILTAIVAAGVLIVAPFVCAIIGALVPILFAPRGILGIMSFLFSAFRAESWRQGILKSGFAFLFGLAVFGGFLYGAYYSFQQGCTIWCLGQVH